MHGKQVATDGHVMVLQDEFGKVHVGHVTNFESWHVESEEETEKVATASDSAPSQVQPQPTKERKLSLQEQAIRYLFE